MQFLASGSASEQMFTSLHSTDGEFVVCRCALMWVTLLFWSTHLPKPWLHTCPLSGFYFCKNVMDLFTNDVHQFYVPTITKRKNILVINLCTEKVGADAGRTLLQPLWNSKHGFDSLLSPQTPAHSWDSSSHTPNSPSPVDWSTKTDSVPPPLLTHAPESCNWKHFSAKDIMWKTFSSLTWGLFFGILSLHSWYFRTWFLRNPPWLVNLSIHCDAHILLCFSGSLQAPSAIHCFTLRLYAVSPS